MVRVASTDHPFPFLRRNMSSGMQRWQTEWWNINISYHDVYGNICLCVPQMVYDFLKEGACNSNEQRLQ
jgi:hypothetical protein